MAREPDYFGKNGNGRGNFHTINAKVVSYRNYGYAVRLKLDEEMDLFVILWAGRCRCGCDCGLFT
ncbi:hypothetical protein J27TS7_35470 [Paenibacillus dendritiformis]|nr:hypothetical protein J27TS7_35470 [Paenibacillus dendritiformis]